MFQAVDRINDAELNDRKGQDSELALDLIIINRKTGNVYQNAKVRFYLN